MQIDEINEQEDAPKQESEQLMDESMKPFQPPPTLTPELARLTEAVEHISTELGKVIIGQHDFIELLVAAVFAGGHVLVEGVPGIAKTMTTKLLAKTMAVDFNRIQFTPDLMPSDVVGTTVFNLKNSDFSFHKGPIFSNFVLIDEINRSPAKTQAALFEVMEEHQVTVDGVSHEMGFPFFVIATQNPIEQEGTYKLPEAQLDRFLIKINTAYPSLDEEKMILRRFRSDFNMGQQSNIKAVMSKTVIKNCQEVVEKTFIRDELLDYIAAIVHETRENGDLFLGASPRASLAMMRMSKAIAAMNGRDFVTPDDIRRIAFSVLNHRIILTPEREMEGFQTKDVIDEILKKIEVPR